MKKLAITLAIAMMIAATGCGDSKSPILSYVARPAAGGAPQLFKLNEGTKQATPVSISIPDTALYIGVNSDATAVTYCRDNGTTGYDIYLMGLDGVEKQLTSSANACEAVFSPDGKTIAYVSGASTDYLIMTMNLDGSNQTPVFTPAAGTAESFYPEFSADGKSLVFWVYANSGPFAARPAHIHANGRTPSWLTQGPMHSKKARPAVAGTNLTETGWYVMNLGDAAPTFVYTPANNSSPWGPAMFSADGKKLLSSDYDGTHWNISTVNRDGTGLTPLTTSADTDNFSPVAYKNLIMFNQYNATNSSWDIYAMDLNGNNQTLIHSTANTWEVLIESYWSGD